MVGRQYCERAATARLHDYATTRLHEQCVQRYVYRQRVHSEWRCPDVGSDDSRSIRIARVEGVRGVRCECGPDRKSRAPPLMKRGKSSSIAGICDEVKFFVAHIRDEPRSPGDLRLCLAEPHNVVDPYRTTLFSQQASTIRAVFALDPVRVVPPAPRSATYRYCTACLSVLAVRMASQQFRIRSFA